MADLSAEELDRLLREVEARFPEAAVRAKRLRAHADGLAPSSITLHRARKQMAIAYARRSLAQARAALEAEGVRWADVPDTDEWSDMRSA